MKIKIMLYCLLFNSIVMAQNYRVVPKIELINYIEKVGIIKDSVLESNRAQLYLLKNLEVALQPCYGNEGIIFTTLEDFNNMEKEGYYPVKEMDPYFGPERKYLCEIDKNVDYYINKLSFELKIHVTLDSSCFESIDIKLSKMSGKKIRDNLFVPLGVYLGELVRLKVNGEWKLYKYPALNPYCIPWIVDKENNKYNIFYSMGNGIAGKEKWPIDKIVNDIIKTKDYNRTMVFE